jgi:hypothetical protein
MFGWLRKRLKRAQPVSTVIYLRPDQIPARHAYNADVEGAKVLPTGCEQLSSEALMQICDKYWYSLSNPERPDDAFSPPALHNYNQYVNAGNELGTRGSEILPWSLARIRHDDYFAREMAAWLIGKLGLRGELGEQLDHAVHELSWLATRKWVDDTKESVANTLAVEALGRIGDRRAIPALRELLMSPAWENDELPWAAADALGMIVGESFRHGEDSAVAARAWLAEHP